jgi:hypothetical protein
MSLTTETVRFEPQSHSNQTQHQPAADLFVKPEWLKLDALVTSLLDIDNESERFRIAIKRDLRLIALAGIPMNWDSPHFAPYREAGLVLQDMHKACR